jgi:cell division protein FtsL
VKQRPFLALWTVAVIATVAAFIVHLALRGSTIDLGYKLGRARAEQARLREVKRVLSLEAASYETPQRVEMVARTLLGMTPPPPERVIALRGFAASAPGGDEKADDLADPIPAPTGSAAAGAAAPALAATDGGAP